METIRKSLTMELGLCQTKRDVNRVFDAAEIAFRERNISAEDRRQLMRELERLLPVFFPTVELSSLHEEARARIKLILSRMN